jgi:hypothetical protein
MHGPINVKSPNNTSKWQMEFNSAFKGLREIGKMPEGVHMGYDNGNNVTLMGTNGVIVFIILTFGPREI